MSCASWLQAFEAHTEASGKASPDVLVLGGMLWDMMRLYVIYNNTFAPYKVLPLEAIESWTVDLAAALNTIQVSVPSYRLAWTSFITFEAVCAMVCTANGLKTLIICRIWLMNTLSSSIIQLLLLPSTTLHKVTRMLHAKGTFLNHTFINSGLRLSRCARNLFLDNHFRTSQILCGYKGFTNTMQYTSSKHFIQSIIPCEALCIVLYTQ